MSVEGSVLHVRGVLGPLLGGVVEELDLDGVGDPVLRVGAVDEDAGVGAGLELVLEVEGEVRVLGLRPEGTVLVGGDLAAAALLLNALKTMGGIDDHFDLISTEVLKPICDLKTRYLHHKNPRLHTDEVLLALTIFALTNPMAQVAKEQLSCLSDTEAHFSVIISDEDEKLLKRLGISVTCEPRYEVNRLYHK